MAVETRNPRRSQFGIEARKQEVADQRVKSPRCHYAHALGQQADALGLDEQPPSIPCRDCCSSGCRLKVYFLEERYPHEEVAKLGIQLADDFLGQKVVEVAFGAR